MPIFPLHTWQPDTYTDAPTQGTMMLSGIMLKMGIYGLIRWMIPMLPLGFSAKLAICNVACSYRCYLCRNYCLHPKRYETFAWLILPFLTLD